MGRAVSSVALALALCTQAHAQEQSENSSVERSDAEPIVVTGSRLPASLRTMPQSVDVFSAEDVSKQLATTNNLEQILSNLVPGLSRSTNTTVTTYLSLRGRKPVFFVDGVPITATLNDTGRELRLIDPELVGRIEVVRGSSALYGNSAGAGFINYITKNGDPEPLTARTEVGLNLSTEHLGDSARPSIRQTFAGTSGNFDYRVGGYYEKINSFFDADGNRIPPPEGSALQDSRILSGYGKFGYSTGDQRIEMLLNYYEQKAVIKYRAVPGNILLGIPATAAPATPMPGEVPQLNRNFIASLAYSDTSAFGTDSSVRLQGYYLESYSIFQFAANRFPRVVPLGQSPNGQSANDTKKFGARIDINTPLDTLIGVDGEILWGADYLHDNTKIPLVDGRQFGIPQVQDSYAGFVQIQIKPVGFLSISAGIRHEESRIKVADFFSLFTLANITGGKLKYSTTPVNAGVVVSLTDSFDLFGGFSQGFDIQQTSQNFRAWPQDIDLTQIQPPPNVIDSYEAGARYKGHGITASASFFLTKSSNGVSYVFNAASPNEPQARVAPDRVHGFELTLDYAGIEGWNFGGSYAFLEGKSDNDNNGSYESPLPGRRIPPRTATGYIEHQIGEGSYIRLQGQYSGSRNKFPNTTPGRFHEGRIHSYFQLDLASKFALGKMGEVSFGIENLLNDDHFTNYSEGFNTNANYLKASGRTVMLRYAIKY